MNVKKLLEVLLGWRLTTLLTQIICQENVQKQCPTHLQMLAKATTGCTPWNCGKVAQWFHHFHQQLWQNNGQRWPTTKLNPSFKRFNTTGIGCVSGAPTGGGGGAGASYGAPGPPGPAADPVVPVVVPGGRWESMHVTASLPWSSISDRTIASRSCISCGKVLAGHQGSPHRIYIYISHIYINKIIYTYYYIIIRYHTVILVFCKMSLEPINYDWRYGNTSHIRCGLVTWVLETWWHYTPQPW